MTTRRVLKPFFPPDPNRLGVIVLGAIWSWTMFWVLASMVVAMRQPAGFSYADPTQVWLALPGVPAWCVVLYGWRLPGVRRLYPVPLPMAVVSDDGLELHIPSVGIRAYRWDEIGSLSRGRRGSGVLRSPDGRNLVAVPPRLMSGNWSSLAQMVCDVRRDRYVVVRAWHIGPRIYFTSCVTSHAAAEGQ